MLTQRNQLALVLMAFGLLIGSLGTLFLSSTRHANARDEHPTKAPKVDPSSEANDGRTTDRAAIGAQMENFLKAFEKGDAEQVASCWTAEGELIGDDGSAYRGRAAIAKVYREVFHSKEKRQAEIERESLRFPSENTAIEEGHFKVRVGTSEPAVSRYSVLHVREGRKWLMAVVREWPAESVSLGDLEWLIGSWVAKRDDAEVHTTYEWMWNKSFIRVHFTIRQKDRTLSGLQIIGKDVVSGALRSWTFESEGGFGEAIWSRDGKQWALESTGRLTDGTTLGATNILRPLDRDSFTWQPVKRSVDGEEVEDLPPVKVTRVKEKK
jgi:uncharacterized protein (TIGR02246 family)